MLRDEIERQILQHMEAEGIRPRGHIDFEFDGQIHRFSVEGDRAGAKSGAYKAYADGRPNWAFMDHHKGERMIKGKLNKQELTESEREEFREQVRGETVDYTQREAERAERERKQRKADEQARRSAYEEYMRAESSGVWSHAYIKLKQIESARDFTSKIRVVVNSMEGDKCKDGDLLIPLQNCETNKFQSVERISRGLMRDGKHMKGIYTGTHMTGAAFTFEVPSPEKIILCEGFATGASIREYTNGRATVICAMNCGNLRNVAQVWRPKTKLKIIIAADNDESGAGERAARAVVEAGLADAYYMPPITGYDYNDYINYLKQKRA